jgi:hypothetical protein
VIVTCLFIYSAWLASALLTRLTHTEQLAPELVRDFFGKPLHSRPLLQGVLIGHSGSGKTALFAHATRRLPPMVSAPFGEADFVDLRGVLETLRKPPQNKPAVSVVLRHLSSELQDRFKANQQPEDLRALLIRDFERLVKDRDFCNHADVRRAAQTLPAAAYLDSLTRSKGSDCAALNRLLLGAIFHSHLAPGTVLMVPSSSITTGSARGTVYQKNIDCDVGLVDLSGERLGTHLMSVSRYRSDHLAVVVNAEGLKFSNLARTHEWPTLEQFARNAFDLETTLGRKAADYMLALHLATTRGTAKGENRDYALPDPYKVKSLSLVFFIPPAQVLPKLPMTMNALKECLVNDFEKFAKLLADNFGIETTRGATPEAQYRPPYGVDVVTTNEGWQPERSIADIIATRGLR